MRNDMLIVLKFTKLLLLDSEWVYGWVSFSIFLELADFCFVKAMLKIGFTWESSLKYKLF